jgi:hypothetical protein
MSLYRHLASRQLYRVLCDARCADTQKWRVVYAQTFPSVHRGTGEYLPVGTVWVRDMRDFMSKFQLVREPKTPQ